MFHTHFVTLQTFTMKLDIFHKFQLKCIWVFVKGSFKLLKISWVFLLKFLPKETKVRVKIIIKKLFYKHSLIIFKIMPNVLTAIHVSLQKFPLQSINLAWAPNFIMKNSLFFTCCKKHELVYKNTYNICCVSFIR